MTYEEFKQAAADLVGMDLWAYKSQQMDRRIKSLMHLWEIAEYHDFLTVLRTDKDRFAEFQKKLTINVSEFFRNPERYAELAENILPDLMRDGRRLRIWSAGCANGAEPYTVAILLKESGYKPGARILGTDIDLEVLRRAQAGLYSPNEIRAVPPQLVAKYFRQDEHGIHLCPEILEMVDFRQHNLLKDRFEMDCDLILCRNVVIYLTETAKESLYTKLCQALHPGGYLMVGGTEPLLNFKQFDLENPLTAFYRKKESTSRRLVSLSSE